MKNPKFKHDVKPGKFVNFKGNLVRCSNRNELQSPCTTCREQWEKIDKCPPCRQRPYNGACFEMFGWCCYPVPLKNRTYPNVPNLSK